MPTFKVALPHLTEKGVESLETHVKCNGIITVVVYVGMEYEGLRSQAAWDKNHHSIVCAPRILAQYC